MKVINLYAGPGTGKSTTAAGLFHLLKLKGFRCEMSLEYAKDCVWEERHRLLEDQLYVFAKQHRRLIRLKTHKLDYVITDSPLLFSLIYAQNEPNCFHELVRERYNSFDNMVVFLERVKPYMKYGRSQTENEAQELDHKIWDMLKVETTEFSSVAADEKAPERILELL